MTIVAVRGNAIASDSLLTWGDARISSTTKKIARGPDGTLAGVCGTASFARRFLAWIEGGMTESEMPDPEVVDDCSDSAILLMPAGTIRIIDPTGFYNVESEYMAIGSGTDYALGALAVGAAVSQAVEAAICHDVRCGGAVQLLTREEK